MQVDVVKDDVNLMKICPENKILFDITKKIDGALLLDGKYRYMLSKIAQELYDWSRVGQKFSLELNSMAQ